jgi:ABC-type sugar transport system substrate-binding protein
MELRRCMYGSAAAVLALSAWFGACGGDESPALTNATGSGGGDQGAGGNGAGPGGGAPGDPCETDPLRPDDLFEMAAALRDASSDQPDPASVNVVVIPNHISAFWFTPTVGFSIAKRELGCAGEFTGAALKGDPDAIQKQVDAIEGYIAKGVSGIAVSCKGAVEVVPAIEDAVAADVPIITFDSDADRGAAPPFYGGRHLYLGSLNEAAGKKAGAEMVKLTNGEGSVLVIGTAQTEANVVQRVDGFLNGLEGSDVTGDVIWANDLYAAYVAGLPDPTMPDKDINAFVADYVAQEIDDNPSLAGIYTTNGTFGPAAGNAVAEAGEGGAIKIVAFDLPTETQDHLRNNVIQAAIAQKSASPRPTSRGATRRRSVSSPPSPATTPRAASTSRGRSSSCSSRSTTRVGSPGSRSGSWCKTRTRIRSAPTSPREPSSTTTACWR